MFITSVDHAKRVAKLLTAELKARSFKISHTIVLELLARMYGFSSWAEFTKGSADRAHSSWDCDVDEDTRNARRDLQVNVLIEARVPVAIVFEIIAKIRPTEKSVGALAAEKPVSASEEFVTDLLAEGRSALARGNLLLAHQTAIKGLADLGDISRKPDFFRLLSDVATRFRPAAVDCALALVYGDAPKKDVTEGRNRLESLIQTSLPAPSMEKALNVLGDIARGAHGGAVNPKIALEYYMRSGSQLGSDVGAFNAGEMLLKDGHIDEAAKYYEISAKAGHTTGMVKFATMMIEGDIPGTGREVEHWLRTAAAKGHPLAIQVLPDIEKFKGGVEYANRMTNLMMGAPPKRR